MSERNCSLLPDPERHFKQSPYLSPKIWGNNVKVCLGLRLLINQISPSGRIINLSVWEVWHESSAVQMPWASICDQIVSDMRCDLLPLTAERKNLSYDTDVTPLPCCAFFLSSSDDGPDLPGKESFYPWLTERLENFSVHHDLTPFFRMDNNEKEKGWASRWRLFTCWRLRYVEKTFSLTVWETARNQ